MLHKLGGAPECHAPELAQELRAAKAEVGACTRTLLTHAHVHPLPCAWAVLVARELCEGSGGIFQLQPLRLDATFMLGPVSTLLNRESVLLLWFVVCRSVLRGCVLPSSPPMSWAPLPTASSLAAQWCRGLTFPAFQTCTLTSCTFYCPDLLPPTQVLLVANSLAALALVFFCTLRLVHCMLSTLCGPVISSVVAPPSLFESLCHLCVCAPPCVTPVHPVIPCVCDASQPLEWPWTLLWAPCQSCWALSHQQSPSAQAVPR